MNSSFFVAQTKLSKMHLSHYFPWLDTIYHREKYYRTDLELRYRQC